MDEVPFTLDNSFKLSDSEAFEPTNENIIVAPSKVSRGDSCMLMSDSDSELDPNDIIQDIPIYLSQQLTNELYIIQYPVRPRTNPYNGNNIPREARFKQLSQKLELDIPLQTNSQWYNHDRGEELALGLNDKEARTIYDRSWRRERNDGLLDKQTLQSTIVQPQANYWMGVVKDVHTTLQLRPGLKYLDKIDEKLKNASKKAQAMEEEDLVNDLKSVKLNQEDPGVGSSKGKGSGRGRPSGTTGDDKTSDKSSLKKNTRPTSSRMVEEEKWKKMKYFDDNSTETEVILNKMYALQTVLLECKTKNISEYIDAISTFPKTIDESSSNLEEGQPSEINATPFNSLRPELNQMPIPITPLTPNVINPLTANKTPSNPPTRTVSRSRGSIVPVRSGRVGALRGPGRVIRGKRGQTSRPKSS
ncbi:5519_t:CDS:2 [Funneliformis mosseae]|uniref:5519_t:CDS:1 n=1 Tax=Funneliformis mosseae TaxID=27381 RepID=A0A9N8V496_FUNMO|nr:5519_t:CDS:2 [Funneliformis mosseae]